MYNPVPDRIRCANCSHEAAAENFANRERDSHFYTCQECGHERSFDMRQKPVPEHCGQPMVYRSFIEFVVLHCPQCHHEHFWHFRTTSFV